MKTIISFSSIFIPNGKVGCNKDFLWENGQERKHLHWMIQTSKAEESILSIHFCTKNRPKSCKVMSSQGKVHDLPEGNMHGSAYQTKCFYCCIFAGNIRRENPSVLTVNAATKKFITWGEGELYTMYSRVLQCS